ncbi:hypothetical protein C8Q74DRAFT_1001697 [Fomes fomentarius]|nr:hypothetical protein C8Q74DRAFT_1001697 [Fomes fomentarius]
MSLLTSWRPVVHVMHNLTSGASSFRHRNGRSRLTPTSSRARARARSVPIARVVSGKPVKSCPHPKLKKLKLQHPATPTNQHRSQVPLRAHHTRRPRRRGRTPWTLRRHCVRYPYASGSGSPQSTSLLLFRTGQACGCKFFRVGICLTHLDSRPRAPGPRVQPPGALPGLGGANVQLPDPAVSLSLSLYWHWPGEEKRRGGGLTRAKRRYVTAALALVLVVELPFRNARF